MTHDKETVLIVRQTTYFTRDQTSSRKVHVQFTEIPSHLRTMVDLLVQEGIKPDDGHTGVCLEYLLKHNVLGILVNVSEADYPLGVRGETIRTITTLANLLDSKFLIHAGVHIPTLKLLRLCISEGHSGEKPNFYTDELIDLLFTLCSKIHASPQLLAIFFYDRRWLTTPHKPSKASPKPPHSESGGLGRHELQITNKMFNPDGEEEVVPKTTVVQDQPDYECLLFSYLLKFIHRDGKPGDYARTGLLFLLEIASGNFRDFILGHSDVCQILAAGLGALYSQLPRKLLIRAEAQPDTVMKQLEADEDVAECEMASSPAFQSVMDSFLKTLEFCQDVLQRCPSRAICVALLSDIRAIFLETILYPSMLESSDTDGSAVAVLSYIDITLQTLQDGELLDLFVRYLISCEDEELLPLGSESSSVYSNTSAHAPGRRYRQSSFLVFNLKDLLFNNLQSASPATIVAALKLLNTVLAQHPQYCLPLLGHASHPASPPSPSSKLPAFTTMASHYHETQAYFLLINNLDPRFNANGRIPGYEPYLRAAEAAYRAHRSFTAMRQEQAKSKGHVRKHTMANAPAVLDSTLTRPMPPPHFLHRLTRDHPLLKILLQLLAAFFTNSCELNLVLTRTLSALVACPFIALDEWIAFKSSIFVTCEDVSALPIPPADPDESDDDLDLVYAASLPPGDRKFHDARLVPGVQVIQQSRRPPPVFEVLNQLAQDVCQRRCFAPALDSLLEERRRQLRLSDVNPRTAAFVGSFASPTLTRMPSSGSSSPHPRVPNLTSPKESGRLNFRSPKVEKPRRLSSLTPQPSIAEGLAKSDAVSTSDPTPVGSDMAPTPESTLNPQEPPLDPTRWAGQGFLDNILILEESIKELIATIHVRRGQGLDEVLFI